MAFALQKPSTMIPFLFLLLTQVQKPLPDVEELIRATEAQLVLQIDQHDILRGYTYHRRRIHEELTSDGKIRHSEVTDEEVEGVPPAQRHHGQVFTSRSRPDNTEIIADMSRVWDFLILKRENINGRAAIAVAFAPKKHSRPQTDAGKRLFKNSKGVVWIDEADHQIARLHAVLMDDVTVAWGIVGKADKGSAIFREWKKVDEAWLPSKSRIHVRARAFVIGLNFEEVEEYSDYRKVYAVTNPNLDSPR